MGFLHVLLNNRTEDRYLKQVLLLKTFYIDVSYQLRLLMCSSKWINKSIIENSKSI